MSSNLLAILFFSLSDKQTPICYMYCSLSHSLSLLLLAAAATTTSTTTVGGLLVVNEKVGVVHHQALINFG